MRAAILRLLPIAAAFALLALLAFPATASADPGGATIVVTPLTSDGSNTGCSLRNAIAAANTDSAVADCTAGSSSGPDTIEVPSGTYDLSNNFGQLVISSDLNIVGAGAHSIVIHAANGQRVFEISNSANAGISGVSISGGSPTGGGGGILVDSGSSLELQDSIVTGNNPTAGGGGIENDGSLTVTGSTIENNTTVGAGSDGGGIADFGATLSITNSTIMNNIAQGAGGGLYLAGPATLKSDTIANNDSEGNPGGGIAVDGGTDPSTIQLANTIVAGNSFFEAANNCSEGLASLGGNLDDDGRCGFTQPGDQSNVAGFEFGTVDQSGPTDVLTLDGGSPAIDKGNDLACPAIDQRDIPRPQNSDCDIGAYEFTPNAPTEYDVATVAELAAAVSSAENLEAEATIHLAAGHYDIGTLMGSVGTGVGLIFDGAGAAGTILDGNGANWVFDIGGSALTAIKGVTVENSETGIENNGDLELDNSVVRGNTSLGIDSTNAGLTISGSTISGNGAPGDEDQGNGGIFSEAPATITNSTISGNNGTALYADCCGFTLQNDTIAGNELGLQLHSTGSADSTIIANNADGDCTGSLDNWTAENNNLDTDSTCFSKTDDVHGDPQLGPLQDNGGPTPTMALLAGSPAIDAGDDSSCPAVDQRGVSRPQGSHCDIGAFELAPPTSIAFESDRTGNSQIFTMNPDGSNVVQLTHDASTVTDTLPSISPDGHTVVYQSTSGGVSQIWAINGDGTDPRQLTSQGSNQQPTFSPDGEKIAFDSDRNGYFQLFVMNAVGSDQTQVMTTDGAVGGSSWSPDGSQIAFNEDTNGTNQIYTVDVASGTVTGPLTSAGANTNPHWSPDGSKILFVSNRCDPGGLAESPTCGGGESVFLMNADGANQQNLTQAPIFDADPAWSPDGKDIAFVRDLGGQNFNVFTADADGTNQSQLTFGSAPSRNSFPNWGTQVSAPSGALSGSLSTNGQQNANLTSLGSQDWAVWGYANSGTSTSLAPDVRKAGGSGISNLTDIHQNAAPLRGLGQFATDLPYSFDWSNGTVPSSATGAALGLQHDGQPGTVGANGDGFSVTVPADTTQRTLTVYTSAHWATGTLTATLSDGSAQPYTQDVTGTSIPDAGNAPGVFTIDYAAASAGQHLTVTWVETAGTCPSFGCDNAALYAVALAGPAGGSVSSASASLGSDSSVAMSGSVPTSHIPLGAFEPQPLGAPPLTINGLQLANTQLANTQLAHTQLANTQLANTQLANTQLANTQLANTQLAHTQLANTQLANTQLANTQLANTQLAHTQLANTGLPLNTVPLDPTLFPNGWAGLLQGTTLAGQPLQTITLHDALALTVADVTSPPSGKTAQQVIAQIQGLSFADIELPASTLGQITIGSLALGGAAINDLGGDLQSDIESQLQSWCQSFAPAGDPTGFCSGANPRMGYLSLIQLGLLGAPVASLQLANTQLANTQLANTQLANTQLANTQLANTPVEDLATSASGIVGMQLAHTDLTPALGISGLLVGNLPTATQNAFFDCSNPSNFNCATGTLAQAQAAGAIEPTATVGDLDVGDFLHSVTIYQLLQTVLGPNSAYKDVVSFGDLVGLFLRNADVQWESLTPSVLAIFDPSRPSMSMTADFSLQGTGTPSADVKLDLPAGFDYVPGSATLTENQNAGPPPGDPTITNTGSSLELDWHLDSVVPDASYALKFSVYGGTTVGATQATETITAGDQSDSSIRSFSVTDSNPSSSAAAPAPIDTTPGDNSVEMSTLPTAGAVDYYTIPMPATGTRISVHLTNLPADYDLALYSPRTTSVRTTTNLAPPLQDGIVPDTQVNLNGGSSGQLTPTGLEDVPDPGIPLVQLSDNRHQDDEDVGMVSPGGGGSITIAVFGYNGAFSPQAYTLRVREFAPPSTETCSARSFLDQGQGSTPDSLPALSSLPQNLNTIILVDEKRLGDTYGSAAETTAVGKLHSLAGDASLGVSGAVVPVETIAGVQGLYNTWDGNPCDPNAANAVANAIANEVAAIVAARPSVQYVVFAGGDDEIPFFRLPDLSLIANESGFAGQFAPNEYEGSLAAGDLLSDDPYLDTQPVPASGQQLFPPNLAGGRLVETAQEIANAITSFEHAPTPGALKSSTGFVSGYDFVADGSQSVANNLTANGVSVRTLDNPLSATSNWGAGAFLAAAFPAGGPSDINSWNGHYDNYRMQMANGDVLSTSQLPSGLNGGILFTMGCHAGFQTTDAVVGSSVLDWPQYMSQHNTGFVGNTGFGLGDTDSVAFSEALMADFAGQLTGPNTLGQALLQAKQQYYLSRVAFSNYDEKTLSEAELYGLPMYGIGHSPTALLAAAAPSPDPVHGATNSTSPSQGSLSSFAGNNVQSANFAVTPSFSTEQHGLNGDFFTNAGQVQAPNYRPLQPYVSLPAGRSDSPGLYAHGVVVDTLTSQDNTPFTPDNVRPTLNTSADEPPPSFTDESWPEKIPTLVSLGRNQNLNLATGQFFTQSGGNTTSGVERLWKQINGRVTYSTSQDFTPPTIDSIDAFQSNGVLGFTGRFSDLNQNGQPGTVVFAQVVYDDGTGHWQPLQLQQNPGSGLWSAGVPFSGSNVQYFVEACDAAGNCGYSSNKGNYFDAQPLPSGTGSGGSAGTLTISPSRNPDTGSWYKNSLTVSAATTALDATASIVSVDGVPLVPPAAGPISLNGDGAHIVVARDSAGNTATAVYLIDTTGPTITHTVSPAAPDGTNGWYKTKPTVTFNCSDNLSGVASCLVNGGSSNTKTLGDSASSQTVNATAKDTAGNTSTGSATVTKVDSTPPAAPAFQGITNGTTYKPSTLPAQSAITCTSSDGLSGLASCVVTGYSAALGTHTLTATATDKAGNTTTSTLTYTVAKVTPTITWNPPASILFGTKLSSTQLNAIANVAGTFVYSPAAGTLLQPGSQTLSVTFTPTNTTDYTTATASRTITVGFSQACLTGSLSGSLTIKSGTAYCIQGGKVSGSITVQSGGSLYVSAGSISGSIASTGATAFTMCGSSVSGSMSISSSSGLVQLGGPSGSGCAADKISASVSLSGNTAGVTVFGDTISGSVSVSSNKGGVLFSANKVSASISVTSNSGGVTFTNNTVSGSVSITNNTGGFTFSGNTISGTVTLKNNTT